MSKATLIDTTKCIGCRSCQVTCKQWNDLPAEVTQAPAARVGLQNPRKLSSRTYALVAHKEVDDPRSAAGFRSVFVKRQCMHCEDPACVSACPVTAMHKTAEGPVVYDEEKCIGCRYCLWACPWGVPTADWDSLSPAISKCTMCYDRLDVAGGQPACVKQCPADALEYGNRDELLQKARRRIQENPDLYVDHIYGEREAGGTGMLYLAAVPFEQLGFPSIGDAPIPKTSAVALAAVPPSVIGVGALLGGAYAFLSERREKVAKEENVGRASARHVEFAPVADKSLNTPANKFLLALVAFGGISFLLRFLLGLGGSTNLSDTYAWGLWIVFDLVWIAVAAGAFATAGLIYVFQRKDLYPIGRTAVFMGLLSYSFVTVTLLADLGLPWHFYQLALNAPKHSAMFEVSWCVGLYVTILLFEFLPVPFERWGFTKSMAVWRKYSPLYVVGAMTLFVYLLSRSLGWTALTLMTFAALAYLFRNRNVPIMLAIAAVTFSTMHQSSLGSLFLLMPDKLDALWWSPILPVHFFLSSIAAGTALMVLIDMWIAKVYQRPLQIMRTAAMGQIAFWSLLAYEVVRLADVGVRGQFPNSGKALFLTELLAGGVLPLILLSTPKLRMNRAVLFTGALLSMLGVVFNRINVVLGGMTLRGVLPQDVPESYFPSAVEWGISIGLIAATIYLFGAGTKYLPILPKEEA
ncbi:MAG TPA: 4Fe-4S dicluster domain-containing protein [Thermoanaerobaculia bacterium]